jgi:TolB protein
VRSAVALAVVALGVAGASPAPHAAPAKRERILFVRGDGEIRAASPAGGATARVRAPEFGAGAPAASPDGRRIAFVADRGGGPSIFVAGSDGRGARPVVIGANDPAWSPDGRRLAFTANGDVWLASAEGDRRRRLTSGAWADVSPAWSPDGRTLVFERRDALDGDVYAVAAAGGEPRALTTGPDDDRDPDWRPQGDVIAFVRGDPAFADDRVWLMRRNGSEQRPLLPDDTLGDAPSWSPDGTRIAFARGFPDDTSIHVVRADGTGLTRLTASSTDDRDPDWGYVAPLTPPRPQDRPSNELLPDLDQRAPSGLTVQRREGRFLLGFVSATDNVGAGPLRIRGSRTGRAQTMRADQLVARRSGTRLVRNVGTLRYTWSPSHSHWHLLGFQRYEVAEAFEGETSRRDRKSGFCLADRYGLARHRVRDFRGGRFYGSCGGHNPSAQSVEMGTSPGFTDRYPAHYHGQNVEITRLPAGVYVLVHSANPHGRIVERTLANNGASVRLRLTWPRGFGRAPKIRVLRVCETSSSCPSPRR